MTKSGVCVGVFGRKCWRFGSDLSGSTKGHMHTWMQRGDTVQACNKQHHSHACMWVASPPWGRPKRKQVWSTNGETIRVRERVRSRLGGSCPQQLTCNRRQVVVRPFTSPTERLFAFACALFLRFTSSLFAVICRLVPLANSELCAASTDRLLRVRGSPTHDTSDYH